MTPRFFVAMASAHQALQHKLASCTASLPSLADAIPMVGAALRQTISAQLPEGWAILRGHVCTDASMSPLMEGLLVKLSDDLAFQSRDFVLASPETVHAVVQILPEGSEDISLQQMADFSAFWQTMTRRIPIVGLALGADESTDEWTQHVQRYSMALDLLITGTSSQLQYQPETQQWQQGTWQSKRGKSPQQPLALAYGLAHLLHPTLEIDGLPDWKMVEGFQLQLKELPGPQPEGIADATLVQAEVAIAVHDVPNAGSSAQATAQAPSPSPQPQVQRQVDTALHTPDSDGNYPLHLAVLVGKSDRVQALLAQGASTEVKDKAGQTPLHVAVLQGNLPITRTLLAQGADPNNRTYLAAAPLHIAVDQRLPKMVEILLEAGAELEARNNRGKTPLHLAAINNEEACATVLLQHGADLEATMEKDIRPLHLAAWYGQTDMTYFLLEKGAEINAVNTDGNSPLHFAAFNGQVKLIKVLINHRADMGIENRTGETYLQGINAGYQGEMIAVLE